MNNLFGWLGVGATVRVAVQSAPVFEGELSEITERGIYLVIKKELHCEGMLNVEPPVRRFIGWNLFQWADLISSD